jgi:hypothetical protein
VNEKQLEQHLAQCLRAMMVRQEAFSKEYDLAEYPAYWGDEDSIVLRSKSRPTARYRFGVVFVGRHAPDDRLTWAWADESLGEVARERALRIRELGATTGLPQFETPVIEATPPTLEKVLAVVTDHLGAAACFADKSREPMLLVAIMAPGVEEKAGAAEPASADRGAKTMDNPSDFMAEVIEILRSSAADRLEALFHGINLPPNWFELVAPEFTGLFGTDITGSLIDISELTEDQLATLKKAPRDVRDNTRQAIRLDYVVPDSDQNEKGSLTLPVYCSPDGCRILLVGG